MEQTHVIGKQYMELKMPSSNDAYTVQQQLSELVWKSLVPRMNHLFDRIVGEEELVRIDSIEIDLGIIELTPKNTTQIVDQIMQLLTKKCKEAIHTINARRQDHSSELKTDISRPLRNHYFNSWLYWLQKGVLPSYVGRPKENWLELVFETLAIEDRAVSRLQHLLQRFPLASKRLVLQHSLEDLKSITELYTGHSQKMLLGVFKELKALLHGKTINLGTIAYRSLEVVLWESVFEQVILKRRKLDGNSIMAMLLHHSELAVFESKFKEVAKSARTTYPLIKQIVQFDIKNKSKSILLDEVKTSEEYPDNRSALQKEIVLSDEETLSDIQFVKNAGLVLLHPFLFRFFEKMKLMVGDTFKDFYCQSKAVLLLHFLSGEKEGVEDHDLVLPKFLCHMPFNMPLDHTLKLSAKEKKEGMAMLEAVLDHWGALGSTSPAGLQEGFLQREGKLLKEQVGPKLYVERKALDILLDRLPWNLSLVKLPWMKEILYVEWN